jgi:plastocyanin
VRRPSLSIVRSTALLPIVVPLLAGCHPVDVASTTGADAGADAVQGCADTMYIDRSAPGAERNITWDPGIASAPERCMQVRVGQQVRWNGSFAAHPLDAEDGDTPNPIATHVEGLVVFSTPGTFGYHCGFHAQMKGAVRVLP